MISPFFFWHQLDLINLGDIWFQQDGTTCHTTNDTVKLLKSKFAKRVISVNGAYDGRLDWVFWSLWTFFFWVHIKALIYDNKPTSLKELQVNIECKVLRAYFLANLCIRVQRIYLGQRFRGEHLNDVIMAAVTLSIERIIISLNLTETTKCDDFNENPFHNS